MIHIKWYILYGWIVDICLRLYFLIIPTSPLHFFFFFSLLTSSYMISHPPPLTKLLVFYKFEPHGCTSAESPSPLGSSLPIVLTHFHQNHLHDRRAFFFFIPVRSPTLTAPEASFKQNHFLLQVPTSRACVFTYQNPLWAP